MKADERSLKVITRDRVLQKNHSICSYLNSSYKRSPFDSYKRVNNKDEYIFEIYNQKVMRCCIFKCGSNTRRTCRKAAERTRFFITQ